jgi:hypothetical protein
MLPKLIPQLSGSETSARSDTKVDKAAIVKGRIYSTHPTRRVLIVLPVSMFESFPQGRRENKWAEDTNSL